MIDRGIELNEAFKKALYYMEETERPVFITGRAGTGKSTLLGYFRERTRKDLAVLAPTGVAAVNIRGQTIHSFFNFRPDITPHSVREVRPRNTDIYKRLDAIVIDEISMVRADLLDCIDEFLRLHRKKRSVPFGGVQMIFIGDLYQLPPVVTSKEKSLFKEYYSSPYFFSSKAFEGLDMEFIELEKVYRQSDEGFIRLLNLIRNNTISDDEIAVLNERYLEDFTPGEEFYIYLTTTNESADRINRERLDGIRAKEFAYKGILDGDFGEKDLPTSMILKVKAGAQVMLLNNDTLGRWVNGSLGKIVEIERQKDEPDIIWVELDGGITVDVKPYRWEMFEFSYDKASRRIVSDVVGTFVQYPLRLAWAITIHKSQGLTFDRVIIDIGKGTFSHGQLYVALSRARSLGGIFLKRPIMRKDILMDRRVVRFVTRYQYSISERRLPLEEKKAILGEAISGRRAVEIVYLKSKDEKSKRVIIPIEMGEMNWNGKAFNGLRAYCTERGDERVFNIEKILDLRLIRD
jgi:ATP-dependent exoDNAse (exonuclease V) alpha subunit